MKYSASSQNSKALVENQTRRKIKVLRSDNGGEYTSTKFDSLCREAGIKRELIVPYNPQQNGVVERKNQSIIEISKSLIHDMDLPMSYWVEACNTTMYILNRCPHRILRDMTLEEAFTGVKPYLSHLHVFGSPIYIHVPKEKRTKLEPSSMKGIFVGYSDTSKAYRVYIPTQRKTVVSRDVKFDERASSSHDFPSVIEESEEVVVPKTEPKAHDEPNSSEDEVRLGSICPHLPPQPMQGD
jgi:hypothetical protein